MRRVPTAALLVLALLLLGPGCASRGAVRVEAEPDRPIGARVAVVYPYAFRWDEPPIRSFEKSMDVVLHLVAKERLLVYGPGDYQLLRPADRDPSVGTDIVRTLLVHGLDARAFLAFRGWAERRVARGMAVVEGKGRTLAASSEDVTYVAHLEVWDAAAGRTVLEVSGSVQALPPGDRPDHDPAPELTGLHRRLVEEAWALLEPRLTAPRLPGNPLDVRWLPAAALDWAPPGQPSLRERMAGMDPVLADLERLNAYRYFDPAAPPRRLNGDLRLPGGLLVVGVRGPAADVLREGDVVVAVCGEAPASPQALQRAIALSGPDGARVTAARGADRLELALPPR
jgi:hypothetical protein